jgi:acetyl-CoA carboxylase biotin carboxyl carrier protein
LSKKKATANSGGQRLATNLSGPMDVGLLEKIVKLMAANDLNTVDVRDGDKRVILKRGAATPTSITYSAPAAASSASGQASPPPAAEKEDDGLTAIKSPMVGTFYSAGSPDAKAFVQVGSAVDEETDVCIIEAMKVFNNIKAETRGTIAKILVTNGQTVEFGQALFLVKP